MILKVVQTTESDGVTTEEVVLKVILDPGESYPVGHGDIVACHDGVLFTYRGKKEILIRVGNDREEPMVSLNGVGLTEPVRMQFRKDHTVVLVIPRREKLTVVRQVITLIE